MSAFPFQTAVALSIYQGSVMIVKEILIKESTEATIAHYHSQLSHEAVKCLDQQHYKQSDSDWEFGLDQPERRNYCYHSS